MTEPEYDGSSAEDIREILAKGKVIAIIRCKDKGAPFNLDQLRRIQSLDKKIHVQGEPNFLSSVLDYV